MGRRHPHLAEDSEWPAVLARVFLRIEEAHPRGRTGVFADLFGPERVATTSKTQSQRTMMQKWRRWTSGASVPARSEVNRILAIAERRGWLRSTGLKLDLRGLKTALLDNPPSSEARRTSWNRRRHIKTWASDLCKSRTSNEAAAWTSRLWFVRPCVDDLMEMVDERLCGAGNTAPRQASLAKPAAGMEVLAMFRATMVEVACQMIETMDCGPRVTMAPFGKDDENDLSSVATLSTQREFEHRSLFKRSDQWAELLSHVGNDLRLLFRGASNEIRADGDPQQATMSARARVYALPFVDGDAA